MAINWATGQLQPFESLASFVARFANLNGLTPKHTIELLGFEGQDLLQRPLTSAHLVHLSIFLSEPLEVVQSVFAPLLDLSRFKVNRHQELHRYENKCPNWCTACLATGIVSELHMLPWILKCPFHLTPYDSWIRFTRRLRGFSDVVSAVAERSSASCASWPWRCAAPEHARTEVVGDLCDWFSTAAARLSSLTTGACWSNKFSGKLSSQELIGKLACLCPPYSRLKGIVWEGPLWHVLQHELATPPTVCTGGTPQPYRWDALMEAYHWTATYSPAKPAYYARLRGCQKTLAGWHSRHKESNLCTCPFDRSRYFSGYIWRRRLGEWWLGSQQVCAVEHATLALEEEFGDVDQVLSRQGRAQRRWDFLAQLPEWREEGIVGLSKGTKVNEYGWPIDGNECAFSWCAGEDITRLLDGMMTMRLHSRALEYHSWLRNLRCGATPETFEQVAVSVQLCVRQNRLRLIHWIREDMMAAVRQNGTNDDDKILSDLSANYRRVVDCAAYEREHAAAKYFAAIDSK